MQDFYRFVCATISRATLKNSRLNQYELFGLRDRTCAFYIQNHYMNVSMLVCARMLTIRESGYFVCIET